jgi:hypothetical protein
MLRVWGGSAWRLLQYICRWEKVLLVVQEHPHDFGDAAVEAHADLVDCGHARAAAALVDASFGVA